MPFTKAQRLKGLKKQLKNMGYDIVGTGERMGEDPRPGDVEEADSSERGAHTITAMQAREEAW